jgi:hypothetical protein
MSLPREANWRASVASTLPVPTIWIVMCAAYFKRMDTTRAMSGVGTGLVGRNEHE